MNGGRGGGGGGFDRDRARRRGSQPARMADRPAARTAGRAGRSRGIGPGRVGLVVLLYLCGWLPGLVANLLYWEWDRERVRRGDLDDATTWGWVMLVANGVIVAMGVIVLLVGWGTG